MLAEQQFERIVEAMPNALVIVDRHGDIVHVNTHAEALFGYERSELLGTAVEVLVPERFRALHPKHRDGFFLAPAARAMGAGRDLFGLRKDGHEVPIEIGLNPIPTESEPLVLASIIDITGRKRAEERFRLVVEAAPSAMLMVDERGMVTLVNSEAEQLFGYSRSELLDRPVEMLIPDRFRAGHAEWREGFFRAPAARAMGAGRDLFGLRKDGREVPIEIGLNPIRTEEGSYVLASIIDISERLHAAQRIMDSLREKEVLLKEIHHRVKNNLAVIGSLFYLQSTTTQDERILRTLQDCQDRVRSMALVHERLYLSEDLSSVDFSEYVEELAHQLLRNNSLSEGSVRLQLQCEPVSLSIEQAIPCGLILTELISNALKHAFPDGRSGEIRVSFERISSDELTLSVCDDGVGLPDDVSLESRHSLGMRLVQSLAQQLDGAIAFRRRDPGTEATLTMKA